MTLTTLAIQTEAWLQEELGAQRSTLEVLGRVEGAARSGSTAGLRQGAAEIEGLLATVGVRDARRKALLGRLAPLLGLPSAEVSLTRLCEQLAANRIDTQRLDRLRSELREVVAAVLRTGRRLAAMGRYHGELLEELCRVLCAEAPAGAGNLVDAKG